LPARLDRASIAHARSHPPCGQRGADVRPNFHWEGRGPDARRVSATFFGTNMNKDSERALEAFTRNKGRAATEGPKTKRDWWALAISLFSLLISVISVFFNFLLQKDHISIVPGELPAVIRSDKGLVSLSFLYGAPEIIFINSGNRSAAFTYFAATAKILDHARPDRKECNGQEMGDIFTLPVDLHNFVVTAGEIKSMRVETPKMDGDSIDIPKEIFVAKPDDEILVCLHFNVVTPDNIARVRTVPAYLVTFDKHFGDELAPKVSPTDVIHEMNIRFW
jgi:hypothetical protein